MIFIIAVSRIRAAVGVVVPVVSSRCDGRVLRGSTLARKSGSRWSAAEAEWFLSGHRTSGGAAIAVATLGNEDAGASTCRMETKPVSMS
ncbi:hypothetical protein [Afipia felis]|uniref:hypothetical protein n=1 Tax=Afipia felis TaxID=1035 RepID=UPI000660E92B|nr:hypothetical protein [Afipia felis]